ncbi:MAG: deoxyguanosinetriphosphate triphosphohydrolase [Pseudomonadota bacterium]
MLASKSMGRRHQEPPPSWRSEFQRDRDRIVHSSAFRRLEYKTQVFANHEGDLYRTRLTHSLEVAQVGRTIARALVLNEDLTEAIALAHDLGHPPFGHAGQAALNRCTRDIGGFEHNYQALRIVEKLERRYPDFDGLNLLFETREGILKHCSRARALTLGALGERFLTKTQPTLEAQVANLADEIAYNHHDIDDGLRSGIITLEMLEDNPVFAEATGRVRKDWPTLDQPIYSRSVIREMMGIFIDDAIKFSLSQIKGSGIRSCDEARGLNHRLIEMSPIRKTAHIKLKQTLRANLYEIGPVKRFTDAAQALLTELYSTLLDREQEIPPRFVAHAAGSAELAASDYIAGMTDRFAIDMYQRLCPGGGGREILNACAPNDPVLSHR